MLTKIRIRLRLWVQISFTALSNGYFKGFTEGKIWQGKSKSFCVPGLNCYSCPGAFGSCPIGSLQAVLGSRNHWFSFYVIGLLMMFGAVFGRFVCGWLCPFGLVEDLLYKMPFVRKRKILPGDKYLKGLKYFLLFGFVILLPLFAVDAFGQGKPWFCEYVCPSGTLLASVPLLSVNSGLRSVIGWLYAWKISILIVLILLSLAVYRPFCRYLCPLGAIYGWFNPIALYRFRINEDACIKCGKCTNACPFGIAVYQTPNSTDCIRCGECRNACPHHAIQTTFERRQKNDR